MRLALTFLGLDWFTLELTADEPVQYDEAGDCTTYPVGFSFTARHELPDEVGLPDRYIGE